MAEKNVEERKEVSWSQSEENLKNVLLVSEGKLMEFDRSTAISIAEQYREVHHVNLVEFVDKMLAILPRQPVRIPYYCTQKRYPPIHHRLFRFEGTTKEGLSFHIYKNAPHYTK